MLQVLEDVRQARGTQFSLQAAGGSGKTFLLQLLLWAMRCEGRTAVAMASTGLASQIYEGGMTVHAAAGVPVPTTDTSASRIRGQAANMDARVWRRAELGVVDEDSGLDVAVPLCMDRMLRDVRGVDRPNGGMTMIYAGDARQTLPVVVHGRRPAIVARMISSLPFWQSDVQHRQLTPRVD